MPITKKLKKLEELFITNKQSKELIGTLEDEVIDEESDG